MKDLVLFCKTYNGDIERFKVLKESVDKFNVDKIPFYVVCPKKDKELCAVVIPVGDNFTCKIPATKLPLGEPYLSTESCIGLSLEIGFGALPFSMLDVPTIRSPYWGIKLF